jgi:ubiquinone/menaquinone biosynthesis C-methylase UbiE
MDNAAPDSTIDWARIELPDAWPDQLDWRHPATALRLAGRAFFARRRERVRLPEGLPGAERLPKYLLQEFHNLPNGNYSKQIGSGYARWFDRVMLGTMAAGRAQLAGDLRGSGSVVDLGCGGGHMAGALKAAGIPRVWGLDPSPYLLQFAARTYPGVTWVQGTAEATGLPDAAFDGASLCFVLHEIPPLYLARVLAELRRIMKPGGRLAVLEPSPLQWTGSAWRLWRRFGWRGLYFKGLAWHAYEPFVAAWHRQDFAALLADNGFRVETDDSGCPFRHVVAVRLGDDPAAPPSLPSPGRSN